MHGRSSEVLIMMANSSPNRRVAPLGWSGAKILTDMDISACSLRIWLPLLCYLMRVVYLHDCTNCLATFKGNRKNGSGHSVLSNFGQVCSCRTTYDLLGHARNDELGINEAYMEKAPMIPYRALLL